MDPFVFDWHAFIKPKHGWLTGAGPESDVVLTSRIRLARNLADRPFPARLNRSAQQAVVDDVRAGCEATVFKASRCIDVSALRKLERQFLVERHLISPELACMEGARAVIVHDDDPMALMINEEDHVRLQVFEPGLSLGRAWNRADRVDSQLGEKLPFAFDAEWGYCTRCPTNVGTGMRSSCLVHLPALRLTGDLQPVLDDLRPMGVSARGFYGEGTKATGDLFQLSNTASLGNTEEEIIGKVKEVVQSLVRFERRAREALATAKNGALTEDGVHRAWGILRNARLISYDEAMTMLSRIRLGLQMGLDLPARLETVNELMVMTQPAHLQLFKGSPMKAAERDQSRAALIRQALEQPSSGPASGGLTSDLQGS